MAAPATAPETAEPEVFLRVNPTITRLATQLTSRNDRKGLIRKHPVISPISSLKRQIHAYRNDRTGSSQPEVFCSRRRAYADDKIWQVPRDQQILPDMVQDNMYTARVSLRFDAETPKGHEGRKKGVLETGRHAAKRLDQHLNNSCLPQHRSRQGTTNLRHSPASDHRKFPLSVIVTARCNAPGAFIVCVLRFLNSTRIVTLVQRARVRPTARRQRGSHTTL